MKTDLSYAFYDTEHKKTLLHTSMDVNIKKWFGFFAQKSCIESFWDRAFDRSNGPNFLNHAHSRISFSMASMPSASLVSNSASTSTTMTTTSKDVIMDPMMETPLGQAVQILEKKVRNLEKRKVTFRCLTATRYLVFVKCCEIQAFNSKFSHFSTNSG